MGSNTIVRAAAVMLLVASSALAATEEDLKRAIAKNRNDVIAMTELGRIYEERGDRKGALRLFTDAVKADPDYPPTYLLLGRIYFLMQRNDEAIAAFGNFREKMRPIALIDGEARQSYRTGLNTIIDIDFALKRYEDAKEAIDELITLDPEDQYALYNLGVYYYQAKHERHNAYRAFKRSLDIDGATDIGKKARYAIEYITANPDSRLAPDLSFLNKEFKD